MLHLGLLQWRFLAWLVDFLLQIMRHDKETGRCNLLRISLVDINNLAEPPGRPRHVPLSQAFRQVAQDVSKKMHMKVAAHLSNNRSFLDLELYRVHLTQIAVRNLVVVEKKVNERNHRCPLVTEAGSGLGFALPGLVALVGSVSCIYLLLPNAAMA